MDVLIVHTHNEAQSFTTAMKDLVVAEMGERGHRVEVSELYAKRWRVWSTWWCKISGFVAIVESGRKELRR